MTPVTNGCGNFTYSNCSAAMLEGKPVTMQAISHGRRLARAVRDWLACQLSQQQRRGPDWTYSTTLGVAIVLLQAAGRIGRAADVERGVAHGGAQQIAAVEGWDGLRLHVWVPRYTRIDGA